MDILPDCSQAHLASYFKEINRSERHRVKYFVCDMWRPYVELARSFFPNAQVIIDKYTQSKELSFMNGSAMLKVQALQSLKNVLLHIGIGPKKY